jgi:hypothetical protein
MKKLLFILFICSNAAFAQKKVKNGVIYKEHPYIGVVKQLAVLYEKGVTNAMARFYADTARTYGMSRYNPDNLASGKFALSNSKSVAQAKAGWKQMIDNWEQIKMEPIIQPQGLEYADSPFSIQSWWRLTLVNKKTKKTAVVDMVLLDQFNKAGKIATQLECYDPSPLIAAIK